MLGLLISVRRITLDNNEISLQHLIYFFLRYSRYKFFYYLLMVSLTGLPPFFLFFVKFNLLIEVYARIGFFMFFFVFLTVCVNMYYYVQPVVLRNTEFEVANVLRGDNYLSFFEISILVFINFFLLFGVIFFPDILLVCSLL